MRKCVHLVLFDFLLFYLLLLYLVLFDFLLLHLFCFLSFVSCFVSFVLFLVICFCLVYVLLQLLFQETIVQRIANINQELIKAVLRSLAKGKKKGTKVFVNCGPTLIKHWLSNFEGVTKNDQTCHFHFNDDFSRFDSSKNGNEYLPLWLFYHLTNNGQIVEMKKNGRECRPVNWSCRTLRSPGKLEWKWEFERKVNKKWQPYR